MIAVSLLGLGGILLICFGAVLLYGAPYLPTLGAQIDAALQLADLQPGDTLLELGSGDGKVVIAAARRGYKVIGYELNPVLVVVSWIRTRRYRSQVRIVWGDFWKAEWPSADVIFTFLLPRYMERLDKKIAGYPHKPARLISFAFQIPHKRPSAEQAGVFSYRYK